MGVTYENIAQVNKDLSTVDIKGKDYVVVPQRVKAFRMLYPEGFILTDILICKAKRIRNIRVAISTLEN